MSTKFVGRRWLCATTVAVLALAGWNTATFGQEKKPEPPKPKTLVDVAKEATNLKTFYTLLEKADLLETLKDKGPYTIFAPTDEAFNKLGKEKLDELQKPENKATLQKVLKNHVVAERKMLAELKRCRIAKTLAGEYLAISVEDEIITVAKAKISKSDSEATNGVLHTVDAVLLPKEDHEPEAAPKPS